MADDLDPEKIRDEEIGLGNAASPDQAVGQYTTANPAPPVDPAFPEPTGFEPPTPAPPPLETDPNITPPTAPNDTLPSGLTGTPPPEALPPPPAESVPTPNPGTQPGYDASLSPEDNRREAARRDLDEKKASIQADAAKAAADQKQAEAEEAQAAHVQFQADRQAAQDRLDQKTAAYEANNKLVDPRKNVSVKSRIAVLFSGLGSAMAGGAYKNAALEDLHKSWDEDTERQKANIAELKDSVVMARTGLKDVDEGRRQLQESADAKNLATYNAALKQGQSQLANLGMDQVAIDSDNRIQTLKAARAAAADRAAKDQDAHLLNQARIGALDAQAQKAARKGAGGGGNLAAIPALVKLKEDGAADSEIAAAAAKAGLKPKDYLPSLANVNKTADEAAKAAAAKAKTGGGVDPKLVVRNVDGSLAGTAGTARAVPALQSDLRTNVQAVEQLKKLRDANQWTSTGPKFHDAVLALAATTTAGKTDTTTAHEKGAITNLFGMPDKDAIDSKIAQTEARIAAIQAQLTPIPDDYVAPGAPKAKAAAAPAPPTPAELSEGVVWAKAHLGDPRAKVILRAAGAL